MVEVLILTSVVVVTAGVVGVWLGVFDEGGWRTGQYSAHCTVDITLFEDVGGGFNYLEMYLVNTGERDIQSSSIVIGGTPHITSTTPMPPGGSYGAGYSATNLSPEHVVGQATYPDGSTTLCVNEWDRGVVG